ncbi:MAG: UvrD-helicase domain-containing protein [Acidobacteriota bacterium]|nr:MAG: UvrD-helicase domain-containing protein [Acidobacteriota bacterium]
MEFLNDLNERQLEAVEQTEGPLLVLAGAGSGKTRVITVRIAYLIAKEIAQPHEILAVTFTNKAAGEMRERVNAILKGRKLISAPLISTFHSLCVRILRRDIEALEEGYTRSFTIYDTDDSMKVIKACIKDLGLDPKQLAPRQVLSAISASKNRGEDHEMFASRSDGYNEKRASIARVFKMYEERLVRANALDFDDLLIKTVRLLRKVKEVRDKYNERYRYILVDEYQDTNPLQFALVKYLTEKQQNICVVGDDAQSIYGFRMADIRNILDFEQHFPKAKTVLLEQNYRSTQTILDVADAVIKNNLGRKDKKLWTENRGGDRVFYYQAFDGDSEARFVAEKIYDQRRMNPRDKVAVLYRTNAQSRVFEEALRKMRIDYNIVGGFSFYERAEVKDVIAYLKLALNPDDDVALSRVINTPPRGIGKTSLDEIARITAKRGTSTWETILAITSDEYDGKIGLTPRALNSLKGFREIIETLREKVVRYEDSDRPVSNVVAAAIENTGYADSLRKENSDEADNRLQNLEELVNAAVDYDSQDENGLRDFIDHAALTSDTDKFDRSADVTLMTVHAAKGLEFSTVFIVGLEDGIFPHARSINDAQELEEERRLAYVAITRAEKTLFVTHSTRRRVYGEEMAAEPSQFLNEMPLEMIEDLTRGNSWLSFARSDAVKENIHAAKALRGETERPKARSTYSGKTYDSKEAVSEFFKNRGTGSSEAPAEKKGPTGIEKLKEFASKDRKPAPEPPKGKFLPGVHVKHSKYGRGLVLRREGSGDNVKLTVSFPGYGQKKLIEKYANLEPA